MRITDAINMSEKQDEMNAALGRITKISSLYKLKRLKPGAIVRVRFTALGRISKIKDLDELRRLKPGTIVRARVAANEELERVKAMVYEGQEKFLGIYQDPSTSIYWRLVETNGFGGFSVNNEILDISADTVKYNIIYAGNEREYNSKLKLLGGVNL